MLRLITLDGNFGMTGITLEWPSIPPKFFSFQNLMFIIKKAFFWCNHLISMFIYFSDKVPTVPIIPLATSLNASKSTKSW